MKLRKVLTPLLLVLFLTLGGIALRNIGPWWENQGLFNKPEVNATLVHEIQKVIQLSTLHVTKVVPVKKQWENYSAFGVGEFNVTIGFDLERLTTYTKGDTIIAQLPPEKIEVYENPQNPFQVVDIWGNNPWSRLNTTGITTLQENEMKQQAVASIRSDLYTDGYIQKARSEALVQCAKLLSILPGTVIITDSSPNINWNPNQHQPNLGPIKD